MISGQELGDLRQARVPYSRQVRQQVPDQDVRRRLGTHVGVVAHLQSLGDHREDVDGPARLQCLTQHRRNGVAQEPQPLHGIGAIDPEPWRVPWPLVEARVGPVAACRVLGHDHGR